MAVSVIHRLPGAVMAAAECMAVFQLVAAYVVNLNFQAHHFMRYFGSWHGTGSGGSDHG